MMPAGDPSTEITFGLSVSLTGQLEAQGRQAVRGLELWVAQVNDAGGLALGVERRRIRLILHDDASRRDLARRNVERLLTEDRVALLLGPYSSGLTMAVGPVALAHGKLLWNHGGTSDALFRRGWPHLVSIAQPASAYLRALPTFLRQAEPSVRTIAVIHDRRGTFASSVVEGLSEAAGAAGFKVVRIPFESPMRDPERLAERALTTTAGCLVLAGSYQSDVRLVRALSLTRHPPVLAAVAAGVSVFGHDLGGLAEGVIGPSQWEPGVGVNPSIGPPSGTFLAAFREAYREEPDYTAAQAYALGLILARCIDETGELEDARLRQVATSLDVTTFFGRFRLDPATGRQIGHRGCLVRWRGGRKVILPEPV